MAFRRLYVVLLSCVAVQFLSLPGVSAGAEPSSLQDKAAAAFEALGAKVERNDKGDVIAIVHTERMYRVTQGVPLITEDAFAQLKNCPELKRLELYKFSVIDADVFAFSKLKKLEHLNLSATKISPDGIREIAMMHQLKHLDLSRVDISDKDTRLLKPLTNLEYLSLWRTGVTLKGLKELAPLVKLKKLHFQPPNEGLEHLPELVKMSWFLRATTFTNNSGSKLTRLSLSPRDRPLIHGADDRAIARYWVIWHNEASAILVC